MPTIIQKLMIGILILIPGLAFAQGDEQSISEFEVIEQRNIFSFDRSDEKSALDNGDRVNSNADTSSDQEDLILTGIIMIKGQYKAILEKKGSDKGFYVAKDDMIDSYVVEKVVKNQVVLFKDGQEYTLKLSDSTEASFLQPPVQKKKEKVKKIVEKKENEEQKLKMREPNIMQRLRMGVRR